MLGSKKAMAVLAVRKMDAAKKFYEGTLGLKSTPASEPGGVTYETGGTALFVYESRFAGSNQATAVTWRVGPELEDEVKALKAKGVTFEHYDMPETTRNGDIHLTMGTSVAWFKDPDGNIHALTNR